MRKRFRIVCVILLVGALGGFAWLALSPHEPVYEGKRLSVWLKGYDDGVSGTPQRRKANEAVRHVGTNAIPTLLRLLQTEDSPFKLRLIGLAQKQHFIKVEHILAHVRRGRGVDGILALGAKAKDAVPTLIDLYERIPPHADRAGIVIALGGIGPAAKQAVPSLLRDLDDPKREVRLNAAGALGGIHVEPDLVVPALMKCLNDQDTYVLQSAAHALADFGPDAKAAVPRLIELLQHPDKGVRWDAEKALKRIDAEAASKAGLK